VAAIGDHNAEENGKKYIRDKVQSATWLIKSIQQRQKDNLQSCRKYS